MKKNLICFFVFLCAIGNTVITNAQNVGINTNGASPDNSAMLDITSTDKGLLIPRMDSTSRKNIVTPAEGLMVFDSTFNSFYFYDGTAWSAIGGGGSDNLGNHIATQNLQLKDNWLNNDGDADEGIYIDTLGNVGIGEKTNSTFHVKINNETVSQVMVDNNSNAQGLIGNPPVYQTFTATATDSITKIAVSFRDVIGPMGTGEDKVMNIYEGTGTGGSLLFTSAPVFVPNFAGPVSFDFPVSGVEVTNGLVYSIYFADGGGVGTNSVGYAGGELNLSPTLDMTFSITSFHINQNSGLSVSDSGIELNNYTIPLADGSPGQILATDGSGSVNWTSPSVNTDNQQLSLSNDSLLLTNSTAAINLNPYLDNTDSQQLSISNDSLFLTNDASAINLNPYLDNTDNQQLTLSSNNLSLTNGGAPINLDPYLDADNLGNHTATQSLIIAGNAIQNNTSSANGLSMGAQNQLLVETEFQRSGHFTTTGVNVFGQPFGNYLEVNNKTGTRSIFGADGNGLYSLDTLNTILGNWTPGGGITFHVNAGGKVMTLDASGNLGIGRIPATNRLEVNGEASKNTAGNWLANSDARLKKNIQGLSSNDMLNKLLSLNGVTYEWNDNKTNTKRPEGIQYGFTAQNIQSVFPTLVTEDNNGFLQTPYGTYDAMTVEAIRALNDKIEELEKEKATLKAQTDQLQSQVHQLQSQNHQLKNNTSELTELKNAFAELEAFVKKNNLSNTTGAIESEE